MSGIAGIWTNNGHDSSDLTGIMACMLKMMRHRGAGEPDWESAREGILGQVGSEGFRSAYKRQSDSGVGTGCVVAYDGRLFNRDELRRTLGAAGAVFQTDEDEEIIGRAYRFWGLDCFERFNGMWALALWDREKETLVLSRDRVGIKPLYWGINGERLAFASELKAMGAYRHLTGQPLEINPESVRQFLNNALTDGVESSFFHGILHFHPGHYMEITNGRIASYRSYWNLPEVSLNLREQTSGRPEQEVADHLFGLLEETVKTHTGSTNDAGVYLTGDINSSAVAGLARRNSQGLKAFTPWFERAAYSSELENARQMSITFGLDWRRSALDGEAIMTRLPELLWRLETPFMDMSVYPLFETMEQAAKEVTVFIDALGGDVLFGGLDAHPARRMASLLAAGRTDEYQRFMQDYARMEGAQRAQALEKAAGGLAGPDDLGDGRPPFGGVLDNHLFQELTTSRIPAQLRCRDRLAASCGLEYRAPLLDHRLIEAAFSLEEVWKVAPGKSKYILRRALDQFLPYDITWAREYKGLVLPFQFWADDTHNLAMRRLLLGDAGYLRTTIGDELLSGFFQAWDNGHKNHWQLWHLVCLETWLQTWLNRLTREINAVREPDQRPMDSIPSGYRAVMPVEVVLALLYGGPLETDAFLPSFDYHRELIQPTEELASVLDRQNTVLTLLWDAAHYFQLLDNGQSGPAEAMKKQLQALVERGHDVQLYLDPQWWDLSEDSLEALLGRAVRTLTDWFQPLRPDYAVRGFRTGSQSIEKIAGATRCLLSWGVRADSTLNGFGPWGVKNAILDQAVPLREAEFLEYPGLAREGEIWDLQDAPLMPVSKLKGEPPANLPFGSTLVMTGRIQGPINLFEVDLCLNHLKQAFGNRLRPCRWQTSIDRRLSIMQGEWLTR